MDGLCDSTVTFVTSDDFSVDFEQRSRQWTCVFWNCANLTLTVVTARWHFTFEDCWHLEID